MMNKSIRSISSSTYLKQQQQSIIVPTHPSILSSSSSSKPPHTPIDQPLSTTTPPPPSTPTISGSVPTFDTFHFVQRLQQHGFTTDQSEAVMLSFYHVIRESMANIKSTMVTKGEQEKNVHMYKVDFTALKSEIKMLEKNDYAILRTETERLTSELERLKQRMREETNRLQAGIRLDMNLEKGRIRDETSIQESKIRDAHARVDSEIANIRTQLESIKYEIIRNVVGTLTAAGGLVLGSFFLH